MLNRLTIPEALEGVGINRSRLWRIRIWLSLPQKIVAAEPPKEKGGAPERIKMIDVYPPMSCLRSEHLAVEFKHSDSMGQEKTNYLLECYAKGNNAKSTWDSISGEIELILDKIAFAFQIPIRKVRFEILNMTPPLIIQSEREGLFGNEVPSIQKEAQLQIVEEWTNKISSKLLSSKIEEAVEASLRWYSKGLTAKSIVDKFAFYWISLEILSLPDQSKQRVFFKCQKCGHEIQICPECNASSQHFPDTKERLKDLVTSKLDRSLNVFENLWSARNLMFHGRNKLTENEVKDLLDNTVNLKQITLEALKLRLGLTEFDPPFRIQSGFAIAGEPHIGFRRKITKEDIRNFSKSKNLLKASIYKNKKSIR
jgi:hypothetical protein